MGRHVRGVEDASPVGVGHQAGDDGVAEPCLEELRAAFQGGSSEPRYGLEALAGIVVDSRPQWLITGLMPSDGIHVLYGAPGTGKSFLALSAALHVSAGKAWGGRAVRQGGVVYVAAEGGRNFRNRVFAARSMLEVSADAPFALVTEAPDLGRDGDTERLVDEIRTQTARLGWAPSLVVLDTLSRSVRDMNESSSQDVMAFVANAERVRDAFGCVVMPVHHCGKDESKGMRGSSALHGSADAEWMVSRPDEQGPRQLSVEKMKDGPDKGRLSFDLFPVPLGFDEAGEEIVTRVAKILDAPAQEAGTEKKQKAAEGRFTQENVVVAVLRTLAQAAGEPAAEGHPLGRGRVLPLARLNEGVVATGLFAKSSPAALRKAIGRACDTLKEEGEIAKDGTHLCLLKRRADG